jgi:hypothetical protein
VSQPDIAVSKPSWPLFLVAALSFVPFVGIFFGGAGATWGFVSSRRKAVLAALIAMAGALANMVFIVVVGVQSVASSSADPARNGVARHELLTIVIAIDKYHDSEHVYPPSLDALRRKSGVLHPLPLLDQTAGAFGFRFFHYQVAADGESFDLFGVGPDGKPGTADDIRLVLPDSLRAHSGYKPSTIGAVP